MISIGLLVNGQAADSFKRQIYALLSLLNRKRRNRNGTYHVDNGH